jgi:hypothetical protein
MNNDTTTSAQVLLEAVEEYGKTTIALCRLTAIDKAADVLSSLLVRVALWAVVVLFVLVLNTGVALWIGEWLGKDSYGFFAVAGFYALLGILLYTFRYQWIKYPVSNTIITKMLKQ